MEKRTRFVVTSRNPEQWPPQRLYEELYCARGDMENRIKEQVSRFADRVSAETMRASQLRLYLSVMAYVLVSGLRRLGLQGTEMAEAQGGYPPDEAAEDRCADPHQPLQSSGFVVFRISLAAPLSSRCGQTCAAETRQRGGEFFSIRGGLPGSDQCALAELSGSTWQAAHPI